MLINTIFQCELCKKCVSSSKSISASTDRSEPNSRRTRYSHLALATRKGGNVHEAEVAQNVSIYSHFNNTIYAPTVVEHALLGPTLRRLLLLLLFDLGGLGLDFTSTGKGAVNYIAQLQNSSERELARATMRKIDLFPCCLEVGVGGDEKIATVQSLPTRD